MRTIAYLILLTNCLISKAFAQDKKPQYVEDHYSVYASLHLANPIGNYRNVLKQSGKEGIKGGLALGGLINPYGRKRASPVFYGAEVGFQGDGRDNVTSSANGDFYVSNNSYWLNGLVRYRPILWSSKINPFADAFFGGKLISTSVVEQLNEEETESLEGITKIVPNYGMGIGAGIKLFGQLKNAYLDIGIYYQQADPTKIIKRNSVNINNNYQVSYKQIFTNTNQFIIRIGLTGFL